MDRKKKQKINLIRLISILAALSLAAAALPSFGALVKEAQTEATVTAFAKNAPVGTEISFSEKDFTQRVSKGAKLLGIVIAEPPASGALKYGGRSLLPGEAVTLKGISSLKFIPDSVDDTCTSFKVLPVFKDGVGLETTMIFVNLLSSENHSPVAEDIELSSFTDIKIQGQFKAIDPEGDQLTFRLADRPKKGEVSLSGSDFSYQPASGKTGNDYFTYIAVDSLGNASAPAKVKIKIDRQKEAVKYSDMHDDPLHYAALRLAEDKVIIGAKLGGEYFLEPDKEVSRSEFLALALSCAGLSDPAPASRTGFDDDADTPAWAKRYISAALKTGVINGFLSVDGSRVFLPENSLTRAEAAVILNNALGLSDSSVSTIYTDEADIPAWAKQAAQNTDAAGIMNADTEGSMNLSQHVTRRDAVEMLYNAVRVREQHGKIGGLLSWAQ